MDGQPVWLCSISRLKPNGRTLYLPDWHPSVLRDAERLLRYTLEGVGDVTRERLFRMNVTLCLHRAATDDEVAAQGPEFLTAPGFGMAGGPVAILSETVPGSASTKPCEAPSRRKIKYDSPHAWLPIDCGKCDPCLARKAA